MLLAGYCYVNKIKGNEVNGECGTYGRKINAYRFWLEKEKVGDVPEDQGVTERKLYEFVLKKEIWKSLVTNSPVS